MSYFDDASLVMIPSGYKDQKVYSVKPLDGSGDLTFSRASSATRVASNGLIEKVRTNNILQSQTFNNASWSVVGGASVAANTTTAPDGTLTADTLTVATTIFSGLLQTFTTSTNSWTTSLFVKKGTKDFIYLFDPSTNRYAWFNLTTGAVGQKTGSTEAAIISVGNGWFRVSVTTAITGNASHYIQFGLSDADGSFTPASTGTAFIWGAQAEVSDFGATDYIATTTAAVSVGPVSGLPRLDYLNSTCPRLLLEPQRSNLMLYSEQFNNAAWSKNATTITANAATSPDGYTNADKLIVDNGASLSSISNYAIQSITKAASAIQYTYSIFAKQGGLNRVNIIAQGASFANNASATFSLVNGTITTAATAAGAFTGASASVSDYGNGWYRCTLVFTTNTDTDLIIRNIPTDSTLTTGNGTNGILIYGAQLEAGAYATSYIPTLGTSVTRVKDAALTGSVPSLIGQTEGVMFIDYNRLGTLEDSAFMLSNVAGTTSNSYQNSVYIYQIANGPLVVESYISNVQQFAFSSTALSVGRHKVAIAYKQNDFALYVDGVLRGTDTSGNVPAMNYLTIGGAADVPTHVQAVNQALLFKTRLTNAQLAELTTL